jgi:hypothetical protein
MEYKTVTSSLSSFNSEAFIPISNCICHHCRSGTAEEYGQKQQLLAEISEMEKKEREETLKRDDSRKKKQEQVYYCKSVT